ncbi:MAG: hypothetical protein Q8R57_16150, partial [Bacteroidota bacterium]|nr:hypothetical protein [Bacteroidota bacterium]
MIKFSLRALLFFAFYLFILEACKNENNLKESPIEQNSDSLLIRYIYIIDDKIFKENSKGEVSCLNRIQFEVTNNYSKPITLSLNEDSSFIYYQFGYKKNNEIWNVSMTNNYSTRKLVLKPHSKQEVFGDFEIINSDSIYLSVIYTHDKINLY